MSSYAKTYYKGIPEAIGKVVEMVSLPDDGAGAVIIAFTDGSTFNIEVSEWVSETYFVPAQREGLTFPTVLAD